MEDEKLMTTDSEYEQISKLYDECLNYLNESTHFSDRHFNEEPDYESVDVKHFETDHYEVTDKTKNQENDIKNTKPNIFTKNNQTGKVTNKSVFKLENEKSNESLDSVPSEPRSERLRKLSQQLPKIIITNSTTSLDAKKGVNNEDTALRPAAAIERSLVQKERRNPFNHVPVKSKQKRSNVSVNNGFKRGPPLRFRPGSGEYPKRLVSKNGAENVALISNVPFEKIRMLNDTFHTLINLRWRWIVIGTIVVHFAIWLVFAVFWYITALAHYDFEPDPPLKPCITGGKDFVTIFLASVEAQTTIGFGDRAIDEECPESIFLFIMQLILGTGLSGVLTCVVYAKLTRPEKQSRDGVGFSKKAVISVRDGRLCVMLRAWDLRHDHIISSEFTAHLVNTHRTKEGEVIRYHAKSLRLQQRQFLLWPVTLVHVIDSTSPLYQYTPENIANNSYEITLSLKGASASMGTFTQSQTSYLPKEIAWGYRFPPVVKYDVHKQKYVIDHKRLDVIEPVDTPFCSARELDRCSTLAKPEAPPSSPSSFSEKVSEFQLERSSSFRNKSNKA